MTDFESRQLVPTRPSGSFPKETPEHIIFNEVMQREASKALGIAREFESKEKQHAEALVEALVGVREMYGEFGFSIDEKIPEVVVVSKEGYEKYCNSTNRRYGPRDRGFYSSLMGFAVVVMGDDRRENLSIALHEIAHSVGFRAVSQVRKQKEGQEDVDFEFNDVVGFSVRRGKVERGLVLEEGVVNYMAHRYVRKKWFGELEMEPTDSGNIKGDMVSVAMEYKLMKKEAKAYGEATMLIDTLVEHGGREMLGLLLGARLGKISR